MNKIGGDYHRFFRRDAGREATFQDAGFIPRNGLHSGVSNAWTHRRKWELLQDGKHVRQHRGAGKIGKPQTKIEWIRHRWRPSNSRYCNALLRCRGVRRAVSSSAINEIRQICERTLLTAN